MVTLTFSPFFFAKRLAFESLCPGQSVDYLENFSVESLVVHGSASEFCVTGSANHFKKLYKPQLMVFSCTIIFFIGNSHLAKTETFICCFYRYAHLCISCKQFHSSLSAHNLAFLFFADTFVYSFQYVEVRFQYIVYFNLPELFISESLPEKLFSFI